MTKVSMFKGRNGKLKIALKALLLMMLIVIFISGCGNGSENVKEKVKDNVQDNVADKPQYGGALTVAWWTDVTNFDPTIGTAGNDHGYLYPIYDTLIRYDLNLNPIPGLATEWEFVNETTIRLILRQGVKFQDGTEFNAEAVKFNLDRVNSKDSRISDLRAIKVVQVVDSYTVDLILSQPDSSLILAMSDRGGMMVSPTAVRESGKDFERNPVGAGPFKFVKWVPNGYVEYEKFDGYWDEGKPYLDKLTIKAMVDENTRIMALKTGEIDMDTFVSPSNIKNLEADPNIEVSKKTTTEYYNIYINTSKPPLDNKLIRQAINLALDKDALAQALTLGVGERLELPIPKGHWAYSESNNKSVYDPEKARQLLKESGVEKVEFNVVGFPDAFNVRLGEAIKAQLAEVGITVNIQSMEGAKAGSLFLIEKEFPMFYVTWSGRPDPQMSLSSLFGKGTFYNTGNWYTEKSEALLKQAAITYDQDKRASIYKELYTIIQDEAPNIPLFSPKKIVAYRTNVKGFDQSMLGKPQVSFVWLSK